MSEDCRVVAAVHLYASVTVVGGDDPVLSEHKVQRPAGLPPLQLHRDRGVGLGVPLSDLLEPVHHVPRLLSRYLQRNQLENCLVLLALKLKYSAPFVTLRF